MKSIFAKILGLIDGVGLANRHIDHAAGTGEEALALAGEHFTDVVVTDIVLGDDDRGGLRVLRDFRATGSRAPVVVITAYADLSKAKAALNEGAAYLLEKPFTASCTALESAPTTA